jgi:hypothetical protein
MRRELLDASTLGSGLHNMPDCFWRDTLAPNLTESTYAAEDPAGGNASRLRPSVDSSLRPSWDRNCADVPSFADEIGDNPMFLSNL